MGVALAALCAVHVGAGQADDCTAMMWNGSEPLLPFNWTNVCNHTAPWTATAFDEFGVQWQIFFNYCCHLPYAIEPYGDVCPAGASGCAVDLTNKQAYRIGNDLSWNFAPRHGTDTIVTEMLDGGISTGAMMECAVGLRRPDIYSYEIGGGGGQASSVPCVLSRR